MKQFFWKILACVVPCALAVWATTDATYKYYQGDSGGFKLGVDLVGGTILVYEIDLRKSQTSEKDKQTFDPVRDINVLAEALKRRIDPNDLYNITIRPAGGEGRIEIILPTGGTHRAKKADDNWRKLLDQLKGEFLQGFKGDLAVGRGKILELADMIQALQAEERWKTKLFTDKDAWKRLREKALQDWAKIQSDIEGDGKTPPNPELKKRFEDIPVGDLNKFSDFITVALQDDPRTAVSKKSLQAFIKRQAWEETMTRARLKWKFLGPYSEEMERINPDSIEQLTTFILAKGNLISQSGLSLIKPLVGDHLKSVFDEAGDPDRDEINAFVKELYGPPVQEVTNKINKYMDDNKIGKDLSVEEVQRIKDLVSKVGSLEFKILANISDDKVAIDEFKKLIADPTTKGELDEARKKGLPPPMVRDGKEAKVYEIQTARGEKSKVTYSWVELGPQERKALNLDNAARTDSTRSAAWHKAAGLRDRATDLPDPTGRGGEVGLLQGALFFSRKCEDPNLTDDERRKKEWEYFVLARDPEFDARTNQRTPRIDGSYLVNAYGAPGQDLRPTVHFQFNTAGGELFGNITRKNVSEGAGGPEGTQKRRHLAIILDGMVMSAPTINSPIYTQGQISGNFTQKEVDQLVNILRAGRLPATLKPQPVSESTVAATLGEDTISQGVQAILLAFAAVLGFMMVYYRFAGLVASVALFANLLLTVGFMVAVQATFTLSGLAGIVLTLGMAVDANVLIYERLREERERGASLLQAIRNGYDRALPTIIDTHLSSIFTAIVLYVVGNDNLKGFAVSMTVGLIISLFTSLFMTRLMFDYWQARGTLTKLTMMRLFAKPDIDFMSIRYVMFAVTLALSIIGAALFIGRLPNDLNIDFRGGTAYGGKLIKGVPIKDMRGYLDEKRQQKILADVNVKEVRFADRRYEYELTFPNGDGKAHLVVFNTAPIGATPEDRIKDVKKRAKLLQDPSVELLYNTTNDESIKKEMAEGKSRNFVIRTIEKEPELVQTCLDQLLRDGNEPLLEKVYMEAGKLSLDRVEDRESREIRLRFFKKPEDVGGAEPTAYASPSFVKSLLNRELRREFASIINPDNDPKKEKDPLPFVLEVISEGNSDPDGKVKSVKVGFSEVKATVKTEVLVEKINAALAATVQAFSSRPLPDRLENFDSALANETRLRALWAILASWLAILVYLWFRFGNWTFGLAAVICLVHDLFFTIGAIAACYFVHGTFIGDILRIEDFKIDLPSVAALLTLVGYSVNDTIVVFDRIREVRGKNPDLTIKMLNDSINQTLSRTILASTTVWLVVTVLYWAGGPGVHLFAFVMVIGVMVGTYSSIYIASPLLLMFGEGKHEDAAPGAGPQPAKLPSPTPEGAAV